MLKRILSCAAAFCLAVPLVPATALAIPAESLQSEEGRVVAAAETREGRTLDATLSLPSELREAEFGSGYDNNPFQVRATVTANAAASNVVATISIDDNEAVVLDEALSDSIPLGSFEADGEKAAAWTLRAIPQATEKTVTVKVILTGYGLNAVTVSQQVKLGAVHEGKRTHTVTLDANGGDLVGDARVAVPVGSMVDEPADPKQNNHRFEGWYANSACEGLPWFNALNSYQGEAITGDITLYAKWTANEFDRDLDGLDFINSSFDFFNYGETENYRVTGDYFALLKEQLVDSSSTWESIQKKMDENWGGSCFGMAAVVSLLCSGDIAPDFVQAKAKSAHDLKSPKESSIVRNTVNYYYLQQLLGETSRLRGKYEDDEKPNNKNLVDTLKTGTRYPVVLGLDLFRNGKKEGGHAVVAYGIEDVEGGYRIGIWDPNDPSGDTVDALFVSTDYGTSYFNGEYDKLATGSGYYDSSFLKYSLRVEAGYDTAINVQKRLAQRSAKNIAITSRTVQLAENVEASTYESQWPLGMIDIETNATYIDFESTWDFSRQSELDVLNLDGKKFRMSIGAAGNPYAEDGSLTYHPDDDETGYMPRIEFVNEAGQATRMRFRIPATGNGSFWIRPEFNPYEMDEKRVPSHLELICSSSNEYFDRFLSYKQRMADYGGNFWLDTTDWAYSPACEGGILDEPEPGTHSIDSTGSREGEFTFSHIPKKNSFETFELQSAVRSLTFSHVPDGMFSLHGSRQHDGLTSDGTRKVSQSYGIVVFSRSEERRGPLSLMVSDGSNTASAIVCESVPCSTDEGQGFQMLDMAEEVPGRMDVTRQIAVDAEAGSWRDEHVATLSFGKNISFFSMGGSPIEKRDGIGVGSTVRDLESPQREGFLFDGWYQVPSYNPLLKWDPNISQVTENVMLYAKWRRDTGYSHRVTFKNTENGQDEVFLVNDGASLSEEVLPKLSGDEWDRTDFTAVKYDITVHRKSASVEEPQPPDTYDVAVVNEDANGIVAVDASSSATGLYQGNTVRVKATPEDGYQVDGVTAVDENGSAVPVSDQGNGVYSFTMPASDVTVSAAFVKTSSRIVLHDVIAPTVNGGTFAVKVNGDTATQAECGDLVTVVMTPSDNYAFDASTFSVKKKGTDTDVVVDRKSADGTLYTFIMPEFPVTIGGVFRPVSASESTYSITVPASTNGKFTVGATTVYAKDPITITAVPDAGYEVDESSISVKAGDTVIPHEFTPTAGTDGGTITFQMPAHDVTVEGSFVEKTYAVTCTDAPYGTIVATPTRAAEGAQIKLTVTPDAEYELVNGNLQVLMSNGGSVVCEKQGDGTYVFTMPASDVTVSATFSLKAYGIMCEIEPAESGCSLSLSVENSGAWALLSPTALVPKGTNVAVQPSPASGWELSTLSYNYKEPGYSEKTVSLKGAADAAAETGRYPFTMPGANVTVRASFVQTRDASEPYLKFVAGDSEDVRAKTLSLGDDDLTLSLAEVIPEEKTVDWDKTAVSPAVSVSDGTVTKASLAKNDSDAYTLTVEPLKAGETTVTVSVKDVYEGGQAARFRLTVLPYETAPSSGATAWEDKATVSISDSPAVAKLLKTNVLKFKVKNSDALTNSADLIDIVNKNKSASEELIHLVDLSFEKLVDETWQPVESVTVGTEEISLQGKPRTVSFLISDSMQAHLDSKHGLFIAYLDPITKTWERFDDVERDGAAGNRLSFTPEHFSAYAIMAKDIPVEHAITLEQSAGGVLTSTHTSAVKDTVVKFTATPNSGFKAQGMSCMEGSDPVSRFSTIATGNSLEGTLTMPDADVRVKADFVALTEPNPTPQTPPPSEVTSGDDDPKDESKDDSKGTWVNGGPIYGNGNNGNGGASTGAGNAQTTSTANLTSANRGTTYTAGASTAGGSTSLVKTGDGLPVAVVCTTVMALVVVAALLYLRRSRRS